MVKHSKVVQLLMIILIGIVTFFTLFVLLNVIFVDLIEARQDQTVISSTTDRLQLGTFFWMVGIVGGCIAITLTYVSWKKYKQENHRYRIKNKNQSVD